MTRVGKDVEKKEPSCTVGMKTGAATVEVWRVPKKLKIEGSYDPVIALLGIYPKNAKH